MRNHDIPKKANHLLHLILIVFVLLLIRIWYLAIIQHDYHLEQAERPQRKTLITPSFRGTIQDRFGIPLAMNKIQYHAAIRFDAIRQIPRIRIEKDQKGKKKPIYKRGLYIEALSKFLGKELQLNPLDIEDIIYAKAAIFPNTSFIIKENIPEKVYCRLKMFEKDWRGLKALKGSKRIYPQEKTGGNLIGYMGAINQNEYFSIAEKIHFLKTFLKKQEEGEIVPLPKGFYSVQEVQRRLIEWEEKMYTIHDWVGKMGIEAVFDKELRGYYGKTQILTDAKGRLIRELPIKREAMPGNRLTLTLSSELQAYAEALLIENEQKRYKHFAFAGKNHEKIHPPWILGGAIVAMVPQTGEILALASYPRFDPNDFISKNYSSIAKWLETSSYIANIWDGKTPLSKEVFSGRSKTYSEKTLFLNWNCYLKAILSNQSQVYQTLNRISSIREAVSILEDCKKLQALSETHSIIELINILYSQENPPFSNHFQWAPLKKNLNFYLNPIKSLNDKMLFLDLLRLAINDTTFSSSLLDEIGTDSLTFYRAQNQAFAIVEAYVKASVKKLYFTHIFPSWRQEHFKAFLNEKREKERLKKTYQHPYTDYLKEAKTYLFNAFWETHRWTFLPIFILGSINKDPNLHLFSYHLMLKHQTLQQSNAFVYQHLQKLQKRLKTIPPSQVVAYLKTFRFFSQLKIPLWGHYFQLKNPYKKQTLQDLATFFYPKYGYGFCKSYGFQQATPLGSLFKIVTGYEALKQSYATQKEINSSYKALNPLTIYDDTHPNLMTRKGMVLGYHLDGQKITRSYKGGRLPKSHTNLGKIDFVRAMARSSNLYFSLLAGDRIESPSSFYKTTLKMGFGTKTNIDLIGEISGFVPDDILDNKTSLYSFAIGQHSLVVTPLQTAVMLSAIANGGYVLKPKLCVSSDGVSWLKDPMHLFSAPFFSYRDYLLSIGIDFPFFTEMQRIWENPRSHFFKTTVKHDLSLPKEVQAKIFESMHRVVWGEEGLAHPKKIRLLAQNPKMKREYQQLKHQFIGKTATAEFVYRPMLNQDMPPLICKDIWFGALSFQEDLLKKPFNPMKAKPDLVVVVYLHFGDYGKEAAPLAAQMIKKWREIKQKY